MSNQSFFIALLLLASFCSPAKAEQRVLFSFDESGHQVHKVFDIGTRRSLHDSESLKGSATSRSVESAMLLMVPGQATLIWQDQDMQWLATTSVPDPRVAHSPGHTSGFDATRVGLQEGAWMANGPEQAARVIVVLPHNASLNLGSEQWPLWLTR